LLVASVARAESLSSQVNEAIRLGAESLIARQGHGGRFRSGYEKHFPGGPTALAVYALAKSGVSPNDPAIEAALRALRDDPPERVYSVAALVLALDALDAKEHDAWIRALARWLVRQRPRNEALWNYGPHTEGENPVDISNTQFAVLGLWAAERHGYRASRAVWRDLARRVPALQGSSGAFVYRTGFWANGGVTTAGMTTLSLALDRIPRVERHRGWAEAADDAVREGWRFLDEHFSVSENPRPDNSGDPAFHHYYYLYGLERVATLSRRDRVGGKDWYREGARFLVAHQESDGSWGSLENTCFALLFLRRATFTTLHGDAPEQLPQQEAAEPLPLRPPGARASFVRRWLVLGPFQGPARPDAPIIDEASASPRRGADAAGLTWKEARGVNGWLDLEEVVGRGDHRIAYAFTYLHVRRRAAIVLSVAHDDGGRVYVDGKEVSSGTKCVPPGAMGVSAEVDLEPGVHRLLFKVIEHSGASGLALRFARRNGMPARDVVPSLSPEDPELEANALAHPETLSLDQLRVRLPVDPDLVLRFDEPRDVHRVAWVGVAARLPEWRLRREDSAGGAPGERTGLVRVEPPAQAVACRAIRRVTVPPGATLSLTAGAYASPSDASCRLRIGVFDGRLHWLEDRVLSGSGWTALRVPLSDFAGRDVLLLAEVSSAGPRRCESYLDEMSITAAE
jgi:hypothetical protein